MNEDILFYSTILYYIGWRTYVLRFYTDLYTAVCKDVYISFNICHTQYNTDYQSPQAILYVYNLIVFIIVSQQWSIATFHLKSSFFQPTQSFCEQLFCKYKYARHLCVYFTICVIPLVVNTICLYTLLGYVSQSSLQLVERYRVADTLYKLHSSREGALMKNAFLFIQSVIRVLQNLLLKKYSLLYH